MTPELFPPESVTVPSPRLRWLEKHGIRTHYNPTFEVPSWFAWQGSLGDVETGDQCCKLMERGLLTEADTEQEAIAQLACNLNIKLWYEETP